MPKKNPWLNPTLVIPASVGIVGSILMFVPSVKTAWADPAVDCGAQYKAISEVMEKHPQARPKVSPDSPAERQCHVNEFVDQIAAG